jgi:transcription termination factor Rho
MHLNELKALHVSEVLKQAEALEIENTGRMRKQELMFAIIKKRARAGEQVFADGVLEILPDGFGFLRSPDTSYTASTDDIYISPSQVRRFNLHTGDMIGVKFASLKMASATLPSPSLTRSMAICQRTTSTRSCLRT